MGERAVLLVDDDELLLRVCHRAIGIRARVFVATRVAAAREIVEGERLDAIIIDDQLGSERGIDLVPELKRRCPDARLMIWSGYATTEMTVAAVRAGADEVRAKPVPPLAVLHWVETGTWVDLEPTLTPTLERTQWEYVHRVVSDCRGNISEAARRLGIERVTVRKHLQRPAPRR